MATAAETRPPAVAGQFYDSNPEKLNALIEQYLAKAPAPAADGRRVRAVVMPHAGYVFSGRTAVATLAAARGATYKRALVIAPSHRVGFEGLATCSFKAFRTPLGDLQVDEEAVALIRASGCRLVMDIPQAHAKEHALEVELPMLQAMMPPMPIVPLVAGQLSIESAKAIAEVLKPLWTPDTLWIVSSDFTHYGQSFNYVPFNTDVPERLKALDLGAAERITDFDLEGFAEYLRRTGATICGESPIKILLALAAPAKAAGEKLSARVVDYSNSGELTNDWRHCVGYAGIAFEEKL